MANAAPPAPAPVPTVVIDLSHRTRIEIEGPDAASFLHNLCTQDVKRLAPGHKAEAFFLNVSGKVLAYLELWRLDNSILLEGEAGQEPALLAHLDRYRIREKVSLHSRAETWAELLVAGPHAAQVLAAVAGEVLPAQAREHRPLACAAGPAWIGGAALAPAPAYQLLVPRAASAPMQEQLVAAGAVPAEASAAELLRLEAGFPAWLRDVTSENLAQEVDRNDQAISFQKGCYLGQETVARIDALGHVNRTLVGLKLRGELPPPGTALCHAAKPVGQVTSAALSPRCGPIALGYVRRGSHLPDTELVYEGGTATVVRLPFVTATP